MGNFVSLMEHLRQLAPLDQIPLNWDEMGYSSQGFNATAMDQSRAFVGWEGELPTRQEVEIIAGLLDIRPGSDLLDVACGYGRHCLLFARDCGAAVHGVDISPGLVETAKRLAAREGLLIRYEVGNARDMHWRGAFDYATVIFNSFSLFSPQDAPTVAGRIFEALKPGGRLFLDLDNKPAVCRYGSSFKTWYTHERCLVLQELFFHASISVEVCRDISVDLQTNSVDEFIIFKRVYSKAEICHLLSQAGFTIERVYGSWDLLPVTGTSQKILVVARKPS